MVGVLLEGFENIMLVFVGMSLFCRIRLKTVVFTEICHFRAFVRKNAILGCNAIKFLRISLFYRFGSFLLKTSVFNSKQTFYKQLDTP